MIHLISCRCFITKGETEGLADATRHLWALEEKLTVVSLVVVVFSRAAVAEGAREVALHLVPRRQLRIVRRVCFTCQWVVLT